MSLITFDLDSTLCDTRHRHDLINPDGNTDWRAYSMACELDAPVLPVIWMARALAAVHTIAIVSGRDEAARELTEAWLARWRVPHSLLLLDDHTMDVPHEVYKEARIREAEAVFAPTTHLFHVDDWPPVALHLRSVGIQCVAVTPPRILDDFNPDGHLTFV